MTFSSPGEIQAAQTLRQLLAVLNENEDLLSIGRLSHGHESPAGRGRRYARSTSCATATAS